MKPYVIIKGGFSQSLRSLTEGGRGVQKSEKLPYVIYEQPLNKELKFFVKFLGQWWFKEVKFSNDFEKKLLLKVLFPKTYFLNSNINFHAQCFAKRMECKKFCMKTYVEVYETNLKKV